MKRLFKYIQGGLACSVISAISLSNTAYASGSDAVQDILRDDRFQGVIQSISWLTNQIDRFSIMIITLTAFFIISAALLKNVLAGAYVANSTFWDKVAKAHEELENVSLASTFSYFKDKKFLNTNTGGISKGLLALIPNIKALTDFDGADIEPRAYFMKAIPQMLVCVIIGVFIYNGFYRDTAALVGDFGSEILNRTFASIDPVSFVDKLTQTTKTPPSLYANDETLQGKDTLQIANSLYKTLLSNSTGLTGEGPKESLMRDCEQIAYTLTNKDMWVTTFYSDTRKYDFSLNNLKVVLVQTIPPAFTKGDDTLINKVSDKTDDKFSVSHYAELPQTASGYVYNNYRYIQISGVVSGKTKDTTVKGTTSIAANAGSWNMFQANPVTIYAAIQGTVASTNRTADTTTYTGSGSYYYKDYVKDISEITDQVNQYCAVNGLNTPSSTTATYSQYAGGTGDRPTFRVVNAKAGDIVATAILSVYFETTAKGGNTSSTFKIDVPISIKFYPNQTEADAAKKAATP